MSNFKKYLAQIFSDCGLSHFTGEADRFERFAELLVTENEKYNLTAITDSEGIILRHFADSLTVAKHIPSGASIIDVGTGAGFPALPLAIARPDLSVTALDSTAKKLGFIELVSKELSLKNVSTVTARAEIAAASLLRESFDVALSRAVARLSVLSELCIPFVKKGGHFIAMKGADALAELCEAQNGIKKLGARVIVKDGFELMSAGERCIIICEKEKNTDLKYPRPYSKIKKSPL